MTGTNARGAEMPRRRFLRLLAAAGLAGLCGRGQVKKLDDASVRRMAVWAG